ncbi:hypothetical protein SAMN05428969_3003 [Devosia sp. YR412]|uniref:DUF6622 family protein n=1 Tax=Devosia sp. YR412 TaxID=1881030 RepID=UPI0008BDA258|nr:DUF6622 family protein [Devosia sp. YR412]SEQ41748.1 hypothetical protein SAMN05428969_3003 [Devosia sp. YR412]
MDILSQFLTQTPVWVWVLFAYLLFRGIKGRNPGDTTLLKMAILPVIFTAWGLYDLVTLYGVALDTAGFWLVGIALGAAVGWGIVSRYEIVPNRAAGTLHHPADYTLLPLLMLTFAVKYGFGVVAAVSPDLLQETTFRIADLTLSGLFTGIFIGKFARYVWVWNNAPVVQTQP